jgi:hypothetical protein
MRETETKPLALDAWMCDICGDQITNREVALVIWRESEDRPMHDFKIVHKTMDAWRCWDRAEAAGYRSSYELAWCLGVDGLMPRQVTFALSEIAQSAFSPAAVARSRCGRHASGTSVICTPSRLGVGRARHTPV